MIQFTYSTTASIPGIFEAGYSVEFGFHVTGTISEAKTETRTTEIKTKVRTPPFSKIRAVAIASTVTLSMTWRSEAAKVHLSNNKTVVAPFGGKFTIEDALSYNIIYDCEPLRGDRLLGCPTYVDTIVVRDESNNTLQNEAVANTIRDNL